MRNRKKVVITGGSGLLASNIAIAKRNDWDIYLFVRSMSMVLENVLVTKVILEDEGAVEKAISSIAPDLVIHTAGVTDVELCERHAYKAYIGNVLISRNVARVTNKLGIKLVHISSDHFSSSEEFSNEKGIAVPVNIYAKTKLEAEFEITRNAPGSIIIRTNFFGWGHNYRRSFSDYIINSIREKKEVKLFTDVFITPILIDDLILNIEKLYLANFSGVINIVGNERVSKYEFGMILAQEFELDTSLIKKTLLSDAKNLVSRPFEMSLSNRLLKDKIGDHIPSLEQAFRKLKEQEFQGRREVFKKAIFSSSNHLLGYGKQTIENDDIESLLVTLNSPFLTQGPTIKAFEERISLYTGAKYTVAVSNLSVGLHLACLAAGIGPGDYVITTANSFVASSNCAEYVGASSLFADIDMDTLNLNPESVRNLCKKWGKVKAIIPVHFAGHPCDMVALKKIADEYGAIIIEDAAHALGGEYVTGEKIGCCKDSLMSGFSFHPVKSITCGEGGAITTNDEEIYKQLCRLRSHGINKGNDSFELQEEAFTEGKVNPWYYEMHQLGYNYRITDMQCALGISQFNKIENFMEKRRLIASKYDENFQHLKNARVVQAKTRKISGNHLYVLLVDFAKLSFSKNDLFKMFHDEKIGVHTHYIPIPMQPYYQKKYGFNCDDYVNVINYYRQAVTLPLFPDMTENQVEHVIKSVNRIIG